MTANTVQKITTADGRILTEATELTLDSFRKELISAMSDWDGDDTGVHAALGNLVAQIDDTTEALSDTQIGVDSEDFQDGSGLR